MNLKKLKKIIGAGASTMMIAAAIPAVASAADQQTRGNIGGYDYEMWNQNGQGQASMNPGAGSFTCSWSNIENFLARMGKNYDSQKKNYKAFGNIVLTYDVEYTPRGNSYMCVYGWTRNPLMEYYIVEGWGDWRPPGNDGENKGTVTLNGNTYDIRKSMRYNQPSLDGTATFPQYWSVRTQSGSANNQTNYMKGTIDVSKHFEAWEKAGLDMSGTLYEVSLNIEGYRSNGSANVKSVTVTEGAGGGQTTNDWSQNTNQQTNDWNQGNQNNDWGNFGQNNDWSSWGQNNGGFDWNNQGQQNNDWSSFGQNNDWNNQSWDWGNQGQQNNDWNNQSWDWGNQGQQNNDWNSWGQNNDWNNQSWDWNNQNNNQWNGVVNNDWNQNNDWNSWGQNNGGFDWNNNNWNQNNDWNNNNQWNQNNDWNNWNNQNQNNTWDWNNQNNNQWNGVVNNDWNQNNDWNSWGQNNDWNQNNGGFDWNNQNNDWNNNQWNQNNDWNNNNWNQNNDWNQNNGGFDWNNQGQQNTDWNSWGNQNQGWDWNNQNNNQWNGVVNNDWNQNNDWNSWGGQNNGGFDWNSQNNGGFDFSNMGGNGGFDWNNQNNGGFDWNNQGGQNNGGNIDWSGMAGGFNDTNNAIGTDAGNGGNATSGLNAKIRQDMPTTVPSGVEKSGQCKVEKKTYNCKFTGGQKSCNVVLPPNYSPSKQYPVMYVLHGIGGDENSMVSGMGVQELLAGLISAGKAEEMIIVLPSQYTSKNGNGGGFGINQETCEAYDNFLYDISDSLIPYIEANYPVKTGRENRAITGFSMGGREAIYIGLMRPDLFGYVGGACPAPGITPGSDMFMTHPGCMQESEMKFRNVGPEPAVFMITGGTNDSVVGTFPKQYSDILTRNGVEHVYQSIPGGGHGAESVKPHLYTFMRYAFK